MSKRKTLKRTMQRSAVLIMVFVILIMVAGFLSVFLLMSSSQKISTEYHELGKILEIASDLGRINHALEEYVAHPKEMYKLDYNELLGSLNTKLSEVQNTELVFVSNTLNEIDEDARAIFGANESDIEFRKKSYKLLESKILELEVFIDLQTDNMKEKIEKYETNNRTAAFHSAIVVLVLGILLIIIAVLLGYFFIRRITKRISNFVRITSKISQGDFRTRAKILGNDELGDLAKSFNIMAENLLSTTISKNYFDTVLRNMKDPLMVLQSNGKVAIVNDALLSLTGYSEADILGKDYHELVFSVEEYGINEQRGHIQPCSNSLGYVIHKNEQRIVVQFSICDFYDIHHGTGFVVVVRDLTEVRKMESLLEKEKRERSRAINDAQEEERYMLARELHDGIIQSLTAISYSVRGIIEMSEDSSLIEKFNQIGTQLDVVISEAKQISHNLIPILLKDFGLVKAIEKLISDASLNSNIEFCFEAFKMEERIDKRLEKTIYRICQEATSNILKHSKATKAFIQLVKHEESVVLVIEDNGIGFNDNQIYRPSELGGIGLLSIRERVEDNYGEFSVNSKENEGTELIIEIPFPKK